MFNSSGQYIIAKLNNAFKQAGSDAQLKFRRRLYGWIDLIVIAPAFVGLSEEEREEQVSKIVATTGMRLNDFPFSEYAFCAPRESLDEEFFGGPDLVEEGPQPLPLWSETLIASDAEHPNEDISQLHQGMTKRPFVVAFYSFKGNTGQSTTLAFIANLLVASGYRVVMLDFDLAAPGLSFMFPDHRAEGKQYGVIDYVYYRYLCNTFEGTFYSLTDCTRRIDTSSLGELYLVPAGNFDEGYTDLLADLNVHSCYRRKANPFQRLLADVKAELDPDILLIDAARGVDPMGAIALLDQADLGLVSISLTNPHIEGLKLVLQAANRQRSYKDIPDLRFLFTSAPDISQYQQQSAITQSTTWIAEHWSVPRSLSMGQLYYQFPYNSDIPALTSLAGSIEPSIIKPYRAITNAITEKISQGTHLRKAI